METRALCTVVITCVRYDGNLGETSVSKLVEETVDIFLRDGWIEGSDG